VEKNTSSVTTVIHNAAHQVITEMVAGETVHDFVRVTGPGSVPTSTGNVTIDWFLNGNCTGDPEATNDEPISLAADGSVDAIGFAFLLTSGGSRAFCAHYQGDATHAGSDGACESLTAADNPPTATVTNGSCSNANLASGAINLILSDPDGDSLTLTFLSSSNTTLVPNANVNLSGSGTSRLLMVTAVAKKSGTAALTFNLTDGTEIVPIVITVIAGSDKNETLNGTPGADMIFGLAGRNTINGLGGNDLLCGGNSGDTLSGGDGDDSLGGQNGDDILSGGAGNDRLQGGRGADSFRGGAGTDVAADFNPGQGDTTDGT
jgi:Ca2+-binding RTX toxin-like protein